MSVFRYRARDRQGAEQRGSIEAATTRAALAALGQRGLTVIALEAAEAAPETRPVRAGRLSAQDRIQLLEELATLLEAGVPLAEAAPSLESAYAEGPLGAPLGRLVQAVRAGESLAVAFERAALDLPAYVHTLIASGEAAGRLGAALRDAAAQLEYERVTAQEFRNALIYPAVLVGAGAVAVLAIFIIVVPRFASLVRQGRAELPTISRWVIEGGMYLKEHLLGAGLVLGAAIGLLILALRAPAVRQALLEAIARLPLTGSWLRNRETGRWATLLGTLLANRVPLLAALELSTGALKLQADRHHLQQARDALRQGRALSAVLAEQGWIAPSRINLIRVGERAGELPRLLGELGRLHTESARTQMKRLLTLIEPLAILVVGGLIGFIMIAVILAITSLNSARM